MTKIYYAALDENLEFDFFTEEMALKSDAYVQKHLNRNDINLKIYRNILGLQKEEIGNIGELLGLIANSAPPELIATLADNLIENQSDGPTHGRLFQEALEN